MKTRKKLSKTWKTKERRGNMFTTRYPSFLCTTCNRVCFVLQNTQMYIKRVIIRGFKTYKNETVIEDFSPHHNVVVGTNGSGKSNFFAAIRFVLSDAYMHLSREERMSLIHESSINIMSAFVEIVFDNTDRRIPIAKDEISIRRTIGMKKDDYSLDHKSSTKSDIMSLLEASGFFKSNPYYIVPQGKVTALTNAKDSERLELLKDIAGARVFETKLKNSLKEMAITAQKQDQIKDMLNDIEKRLDELNIEKEDLKIFEKLNNKKKMLEFNIYDREMNAITDQISKIDDNYSISAQETESLNTELEQREIQISNLENDLLNLQSKETFLKIDFKENENELQDIFKKLADINIQLQDNTTDTKSSTSSESYLQNINSLKLEIKNEKSKIGETRNLLNDYKNKEVELKFKIEDLRQKQMLIISKKNQSSKFSSKTERDKYIKTEISGLNETKDKKQQLVEVLKTELQNTEKSIKLLQEEDSKRDSTKELDDAIDNFNNQISVLKTEARNLVDDRSLDWRKESKLNSVIAAKEEQLSTVEQSLRGNIDRMTINALDTVKRIAHRLGPNIENGIYGYLGELIDVSEKYKTAVDVIGGNSLFHIVVNNDQTASILINEMKKEKNCRTTFIPLNRLKNDDFNFPNGNDFVPLIKKIAYDSFLGPAIKQIFGRTVVCVSLQKGYELASAYQLTAITLDGDRCNNNGVLTGGYRDFKVSRLDYLKNLRTCKAEIFQIKEEISQIKSEINEKDFSISTNYQKTLELKNSLNLKLSEKSEILSKFAKIENSIAKYQQEVNLIENKIKSNEFSIESIQQKIDNFNDELDSPFSQNSISSDDDVLLRKIYQELPLLEKEQQKLLVEIDKHELNISSMTTFLTESIYPRYNQLKLEFASSKESEKDNDFANEDLQRRFDKTKQRETELKKIETEINSKLSDLKKQINSKTDQINELNDEQEAFIKQFEDYGKSTDKNLVKKVRLKSRKHELEKSIGELGALPEETLTLFEGNSTESLSKKLTVVNQRLKSYNHINKKAMEQFAKFSKQRDTLFERLDELNEAKGSIENLIKVLQNRKNDAIIRTFREVSIGFSKIFEQLVPLGKGKLIIQKKKDLTKNTSISLSQYPDTNTNDSENEEDQGDDSSDDESTANENKKSIDSFIGISIVVSFNSKKDEQLRLEQLSGGQKSLCALALILAIQNCDPAPFYLFDEIDSNLDAQYRTAVANLVHKLSAKAQFICTTFRPEMLKVSDKFYGVMFNNKVSTISNIDAERALDFVEDQHHV